MRTLPLLVACSLLSLGPLVGCGEPAPSDDGAAPSACCSVDEVIAMSRAGVHEELIVRSIRQGDPAPAPGPADLIRMSDAQVSKRVIEAMMGESAPPSDAGDAALGADGGTSGGAGEAATPSAAAAPAQASATPAGPPPLSLAVAYVPGSKTLTITNSSDVTYTDVVLTANDEYVYALPIPLPPGNPDRVKIASFTSPKTGHKLFPAEGIRSLRVKTRQGSWSQRF